MYHVLKMNIWKMSIPKNNSSHLKDNFPFNFSYFMYNLDLLKKKMNYKLEKKTII